MAKYPPYVDAYGKISDVFEEIRKAAVPPKFTQDFLSSVLGLTSSSYRAMIPLLKKLGFLDQANNPTEVYKKYREESQSQIVLGEQVKKAYEDLYKAAEYAHKLKPEELASKLKTVLGVGDKDKNLKKVIGTYQELVKLSSFDGKKSTKPKIASKEPIVEHLDSEVKPPLTQAASQQIEKKFGISYTINLNLPATTEIEVYNSIFKALKENLLDD